MVMLLYKQNKLLNTINTQEFIVILLTDVQNELIINRLKVLC